jgi:hypothetical protein
MDETTYEDPKVMALSRQYFVAIRVDQDSMATASAEAGRGHEAAARGFVSYS